MKIRLHTLVFLTSVGIIFTIIYWGISQAILLPNFIQLEKERAERNVKRAIEFLDNEKLSLSILVNDWGQWDDLYAFAKTGDAKFLEVNITDDWMNSADITFFGVYRPDRSLVYASIYDKSTKGQIQVPELLQKQLVNRSDFFSLNEYSDGLNDLISVSGNLYVLSVHPILSSDHKGPSNGVLFMGRKIDEGIIKRLNQSTLFMTHVTAIDEDYIKMYNNSDVYDKNSKIHLKVNENSIIAYYIITDLLNHQVASILVSIPTDILQRGHQAILMNAGSSVFLICIIVIFTYFFVTVIVIKPIQKLLVDIGKISKSGKFSLRVRETGKSEIAQVGHEMNRMLSIIDTTNQRESEQKRLLEENSGNLKNKITELEEMKKAMLNLLDDERKLETDLKNERDTAQAVISSMGEGLIVLNKDATIRYLNQMAKQLMDIKEDEAIGKTLYDIVKVYQGEKELPQNERPSFRTLNLGQHVSSTLADNYILKTYKGRFFPMIVTTTPLIGDGITGATIVFRDSTNEKQNQETIERLVKIRTNELSEKNLALEKAKKEISEGWLQQQQEKARLSASINGLSLGFIMTDTIGNILTVNKAALGILKTGEHLTQLKQIEEKFQDNLKIHDLFIKCTQERTSIKISNLEFDNKYFRFFMAPILMKEEEDRLIGTVILFEDVTEAHILERSKDEFFSIASHELRTPLTAVRGNTELIRQYFFDKIDDSDFREMIDDIHTSSVRLITLVNDFLDTSRLEQGRMKFNNISFDLPDLVGETVKSLEAIAAEKNLRLVINRGNQSVSQVVGDRDKVKEIILNLVGNAIKFSNQGEIKITVFDSEITKANKDQIAVSVTDAGRGISPQNQMYLFHKFQQATSSIITRDTTKGTGLGLYISKLMVEGMDGSIFLEKSEEGKGATFAFTLPRVKA